MVFGRSPLLPIVTHDDGSQSDPLLVATTEEAIAAAAALQFPPGFIFGSATSAYQVEGGIVDTNWNRWEQQKTKRGGGDTIRNGEECGRACDMWNLFEDVDLPLIEQLGLGSFRFSVEWSRIEPAEGVFDDAALARYERWCTLLRARNIEPCAAQRGRARLGRGPSSAAAPPLCAPGNPKARHSQGNLRGHWVPSRSLPGARARCLRLKGVESSEVADSTCFWPHR